MNKFSTSFGLFWMAFIFSFGQTTMVVGTVVRVNTTEPIVGANVSIEGTTFQAITNQLGVFELIGDLPLGEQKLILNAEGFQQATFEIVIYSNRTLTLDSLFMHVQARLGDDLFTITLTDDELTNDTSSADNISGLLQSTQDVFLRTVAFDFGPSFFKMRGLDSNQGQVLINGLLMNKFYNNRPQWSNWGGLNDVLRNRVYTSGFTPSSESFGAVLGATNMSTKASEYRPGARITYSSSNRSYLNRIMATYASGLVRGGWAYALSGGRRWGDEGFQKGTFYDANSFFVAVEKKINKNHAVYFSGIYTPNRRGKSSPNTQEVYDLKSIKYNEYWGYHDKTKRNSRIKVVDEPILMLGHSWQINRQMLLQTNAAFQFGKIGQSRLDFANGENPSPAYYQRLPSYALANPNGPDYAQAYLYQETFVKNGQIDWNRIYDANLTNKAAGLNAAYVLFDDRTDDHRLILGSNLNWTFSDRLNIYSNINFRKLKSHNFAVVTDLLGGLSYANIDAFDGFQYDLNQPDKVIHEGDIFRYNYQLEAVQIRASVQADFNFDKIDFYAGLSMSQTTYQREGLFDNEANSDNSFGLGPKVNFKGRGIKAGLTYNLSGIHRFDLNGAYVQKAPSLSATYTNVRVNHNLVGRDAEGRIPGTTEISETGVNTIDLSYILRSSMIQGRLTGFYTTISNANQTSFYYADGLGGFEQTSEFIQEVLQGIDSKHLGVECGVQVKLNPTLELKAVAALGHYSYDNNPLLYVASDASSIPMGKAYLKNYRLASGPQTAYALGLEYRDPKFWWMGLSVNLFQDVFIDVSPLQRTANFYADPIDGLPFVEYDESVARELLKQERFEDYFTVNMVGGKSWKIGDRYLGLFMSINNLLNEIYKTGGFEQGRSANFRTLLEDVSHPKRVFGPKYWYGRGTTYFLNLNLRM